MECAGIVFLLLALGAAGAAGGCSHANTLGLLAADCHGLQLRHAPTTLRTDIEALDLTFNRLRALPALGAYSRLELLYLDDNAISALEEAALQQLPRLRVLSLRLNSITTVPASLLALLPALRRLDLSENPLVGASLAAALVAAPPAAPLEALEVAAAGALALIMGCFCCARRRRRRRLREAAGGGDGDCAGGQVSSCKVYYEGIPMKTTK